MVGFAVYMRLLHQKKSNLHAELHVAIDIVFAEKTLVESFSRKLRQFGVNVLGM